MARKPPPEHTRFKPGQSGNPSGAKPFLTRARLNGALSKMSKSTIDEVRKIFENPRSTALEAMLASIVIKIYEDGDAGKFNFLLDRAVGRVKETTEIILPKPTVVERLDGTSLVLSSNTPQEIDGEILEDTNDECGRDSIHQQREQHDDGAGE